MIGLHLDDVPFNGLGPIATAEISTGPIGVVHWFQAWGGGHAEFRHDWLDLVTASGRHGLITWEPWALTGQSTQPDYAPAAIIGGDHDDYISAWAERFAERTDGPWYLRPMHEMNGTWYPWACGVGHTTPEQYRAAWRHLHRLFDEAGANRSVRWVWCPLADDIAGPFEDCYPGDEVVDVLALDGYNWGSGTPEYGGWRSPEALFATALDRLTALGPQPIWLAEVGCAPDGDKAAWTTDLLDGAGLGPAHDRIEAVVFFGLDKERDWRIDADPAVATRVRSHHRRRR